MNIFNNRYNTKWKQFVIYEDQKRYSIVPLKRKLINVKIQSLSNVKIYSSQ